MTLTGTFDLPRFAGHLSCKVRRSGDFLWCRNIEPPRRQIDLVHIRILAHNRAER